MPIDGVLVSRDTLEHLLPEQEENAEEILKNVRKREYIEIASKKLKTQNSRKHPVRMATCGPQALGEQFFTSILPLPDLEVLNSNNSAVQACLTESAWNPKCRKSQTCSKNIMQSFSFPELSVNIARQFFKIFFFTTHKIQC